MRPPLVLLLALATAAGIIWRSRVPVPLVWLATALVVSAISAGWSLRRDVPRQEKHRPGVALAWLLVGFAALGALVAGRHLAAEDRSILAWAARHHLELAVVGTIRSRPAVADGAARFLFAVEAAKAGSGLWRRLDDSAEVIARYRRRFPDYDIGQRLRFVAIPQPPRNSPGDFDYRRYLARRHVYSVMVVQANELVSLGVKDTVAQRYRRLIRAEVLGSLGRPLGPLMLALLFGETDSVPDAVKLAFQRAGVLHLFAVSGLNVTLAAGAVLLVCRWLHVHRAVATALALAGVLFYFWLIGSSPSVNRATVMVAVGLMGWFFGRQAEPLALVGLAALLLMLAAPLQIFDAAFQLSFAGTAGILVIGRALVNFWRPELRSVALPLAVTVGAELAVVPILAVSFGQVPLTGVIANLVLVPPVAVITAVGFGGALVSAASRPLGRLAFWSVKPLLAYLIFGARFFADVPGAVIYWQADGWQIAIYALGLILFVVYLRARPGRAGAGPIVLLLLVVLGTAVWVQAGRGRLSARVEAVFLDVGEGDAILIRSREGGVVLVDGGPDWRRLERELDSHAVRRINLVILSHPHADHVAALAEVVRRYPIDAVIEPGFQHPSGAYREFLRAVAEAHIRRRVIRRPAVYRIGALRVRTFLPHGRLFAGTDSDPNNNSLVATVSYRKFSLLLAGDIQREAIARLLSRHVGLRSTVLKVSHQGSSNGTTRALLRAIRPAVAVISVGAGNPFGHPHGATLRLLNAIGAHIYRTDRNGTVTVGTDGLHTVISTEK